MRSNSSRWKGWVIAGAIMMALAAAAIWYWKHPSETAVAYQTDVVERGDLQQTVTATGQLNPVKNVTVGSQISGIILSLFADFNSQVKEGEVIAQLDPATYKANVASAEGDLANARANLELTQVDYKRADELFKSKLIAQSDYDKALAALHQAEAQVKMKEASLQRANVDLSRCTIYAPVDGIVISRAVDVGQTVAASLSAPELFVIANDLTKMQIDANVSEADVGGVEVGQDVEFTVDAFPYRTFHGKVTQVRNAPTTVQNVVTYDTVIGVNNDDLKLKPGMTANVSIITARRENVLKIPNSALRFRLPESVSSETRTNANPARAAGNGSRAALPGGPGRGGRTKGQRANMRVVYTLTGTNAPKDGAIPQPTQIKTGISDGIYTEIVDGLSEGASVVISSTASEDPAAGGANPFGGGFGRRRF